MKQQALFTAPTTQFSELKTLAEHATSASVPCFQGTGKLIFSVQQAATQSWRVMLDLARGAQKAGNQQRLGRCSFGHARTREEGGMLSGGDLSRDEGGSSGACVAPVMPIRQPGLQQARVKCSMDDSPGRLPMRPVSWTWRHGWGARTRTTGALTHFVYDVTDDCM